MCLQHLHQYQSPRAESYCTVRLCPCWPGNSTSKTTLLLVVKSLPNFFLIKHGITSSLFLNPTWQYREKHPVCVCDTWTLQHIPGPKACFQCMQMHSGQDQKPSTVLHMEKRSYLVIKYSSLSFLRRCSCYSYPVLNFCSWLPLSKGAMKPKSDSSRRCGYEHISWVVTTCSILTRYLQGMFLGAKDASAKGIFSSRYWRVTVWTVSSPCIFWIPLGLTGGFHRNLKLSPTFDPVSCVSCLQLFLSCLTSYESSPLVVWHLPVAGRKNRS